MWRPNNWDEILDDIRFHHGDELEDKIGKLNYIHLSLVEAGASAILKVLKEQGSHYDSILEVDRLTRQDLPDVEGGFTLCVIPDEEV